MAWLWIRLALLVVLAVVPSFKLLWLFIGVFAAIYLFSLLGNAFSIDGLIHVVGLEVIFYAAGAGVILLRRMLSAQKSENNA